MARGGGGGVEFRPPPEMAMEEMDRQPVVVSEARILRMEIASLVNLLIEKQSDVLSYDPEIMRKITSLRSEIACQKLARERKALVTEVKRTVPRRRKKFYAVRRVAEKEIMADQESVDLPNSDTHSVTSQVSCIPEQLPEPCDQKEIDSENNKSASRFKSNFEHVYSPYGIEDEGVRLNRQFSHILQQADALCDEMASIASILRKISVPIISYYDVSDLCNTAQSLSRISNSILYNSMNADKQMAVQYAEDQRTKEEMTDQMGKGKSSTHCLEKQRTEEEVDVSITDLTDHTADDGQLTDDEGDHFVGADLISCLSNQMTAYMDDGQSSAETHESRMMDKGKSISEGKSSMETHASRMLDMMVLVSDDKSESDGMTNLCKYYKMLEFEDEKVLGKMTAENLRMYYKFRTELLKMEASLREFREQNEKDDLRWEQDKKDALSCCRTDPTPFSLQDAVGEEGEEEGEEEEVTEFTESDKEEMEMEDRLFSGKREVWESAWGCCGEFEDSTAVSPMHFTHCTPGLIPYAARSVSTLQIYSLKIVGTDGKLKLPLHVYGVVAARDTVDYNRNILFFRRREDCQKLTPEDPFLHLTGPSRAIVAVDHVDFEVQLKVKGATRSSDRALISRCCTYSGGYHEGLDTALISNCFCTVELSLERLAKTVQATTLSVRVVEGGPWPFEYGGRIVCSSPPQEVMDSLARQVVLVDSRSSDGGEMPMGTDGYLDLSRHVVSVELEESLQFVIQAYSQSGDAIARQGRVKFRAEYCNVSRGICEIGDSKVEITVAWSKLVTKRMDILLEGHV
ncbi:hypothetical protein CFC21_006302 [Triticum aestivum]|uniref:DUF6598 domain-containing protein n=2 Tax=Triticum aestivum TaxID=4565 RepID=A0A9R1DBK7_WHEAT|nr:uncharacterized protein LOC123119574 [Triticum aestivum]KAF6988868.1 hypothetical protein CFC21_006302 [Triticum aestivum]